MSDRCQMGVVWVSGDGLGEFQLVVHHFYDHLPALGLIETRKPHTPEKLHAR